MKKKLKIEAIEPASQPILRTRKIKVFPTHIEKQKIDKWIGVSRWVYNQGVHLVKTDRSWIYKTKFTLLQELRRILKTYRVNPEYKWLDDVPDYVRDCGVQDFAKAIKSTKALMKNKPGVKWEMRYRSKKKLPQETLSIPGRAYNSKTSKAEFYFVGHMKTNRSDKLPTRTNSNFQFIRTRLHEYFVNVVEERHVTQDLSPKSVIALDPGVRTFQTGYSPDGSAFEWGGGDMKVIFALCVWADKLQGGIAKETNSRRRKSKKRAWLKMLARIKNRVDECHRKLSTYLCQEYSVILLPAFETNRMVRKRDRKIGKGAARGMCTWAHFRFRERLIAKAKLYANTEVIICDEQWTTKTCGECGVLHNKIGSNKVFRCPSCDNVSDRDIHAARNILLRYLTLNKISVIEGTQTGSLPLQASIVDTLCVVDGARSVKSALIA